MLIKIDHLSFTHEGNFEMLFDDVSFQLDTEWKTGLIGRNGKGKTTLLHLLRKDYPYHGNIQTNVIFDLFPFEVTNTKRMTLEILEEVSPATEDWQIMKEMALLDVDAEVLYRPFETLSMGERTKVLLATLFTQTNHFLLIDEPTNHLDYAAREVLAQYLQRKKGFLLVSHDRTFLDHSIDHVVSISRNKIEVQQGNFSTWKQNKEFQDQFEMDENQRLKKDIGRLNEAERRQAVWSDKVEKTKIGTRIAGLKPDRGAIGAQAARMMKKAKNAEKRMNKAIEMKEELLHDIDHAPSLKLTTLPHHNKTLFRVEDVSIFYDQKEVVSKVSFVLQQNERLAILGKNGSGKSSLVHCLLNEADNYTGTIQRASQLMVSYVSQDTRFLKGTCMDYAKQKNIDVTLFLTILRKLDFRRELFERDFTTYSEGQKKKVLIAASLSQPAHLYLWDEPLNYIDVLSRMQIEELILSFEPTMIVIEHDRTFIAAIATKTIVL